MHGLICCLGEAYIKFPTGWRGGELRKKGRFAFILILFLLCAQRPEFATAQSESAPPADRPLHQAGQLPPAIEHESGHSGRRGAETRGQDQKRAVNDGSEDHFSPHRKLLVGVMNGPPWSMQDEDGHWTGITVDLWREVATTLDWDYDFKVSDLDGVMKAAHDGTVDVSAAGLAITSERDAIVDFSDPYFVFNQTVAVNADQQPSFLHILRTAVFSWGFVAVVFLMIAIAIFGGFVLWLLEKEGKSEHYNSTDKKGLFRALFWSTMVLSGRDLPSSTGWKTYPPATFAGRLFGVTWMLLGIALFSLFTAGAASLFTSRQLQAIVNSPDDLRHVKVGTVIGSAAQAYMNRHNIKYVTYETPLQLVNALGDHKIDAAVYGSTTLSYYAKTIPNKIVVLRFSLRQDFAAFPVPQGSPLRKPINRALLQVLESKRWQAIVSHYVTND